MGFRLLVFDWDGTLMDSAAQIVSCMHKTIGEMGLPGRSDEAIRNIIGLGLYEAIDALYPGQDSGFHERFTAGYRVHWLSSNGTSRLFSGAEATLRALHAGGLHLAVATGKGRRGLDKVLGETGLQGIFCASRCADESGSKPHPRMLQELMAAVAVDASETVMIGDTEYDMQMARNAGTAAVAVDYGVHAGERLLRYQPLALLHDVREVLAWLDSVNGSDFASLVSAPCLSPS